MFFRQYELGCLSLYSYMIADSTTGHAVVVDPQRDISMYLEEASNHDLTIERIIETHFHADFVSGHLELAAATGAAISYGTGAETDFPHEELLDGQRLVLGEEIELEIRATPGHTPESISIVIIDRTQSPMPWGVLTGDTLFIGDVGRPDLLASAGITADELCRKLFHSIHERLLSLPDATRVFPAHGAGSACGKAMSSAPSSTIGEQRLTNYALQPMAEEAFVTLVTRDQPLTPAYFRFAASTNRQAHQLLDAHSFGSKLSAHEMIDQHEHGAILLDGRSTQAFASGHLRGSINVPLDGRFAETAGNVVQPDKPIIVITDPGRENEARTRLARIGFDMTIGYLLDIEAVLAQHPEQAEQAWKISATDLANWIRDSSELQILDVRNPVEQHSGVIAGSVLLPLPNLREHLPYLDHDRATVVLCASGTRSSVAASLLRSEGFKNVADVLGGFMAWTSAGLPTTSPVG